MSYVVLVDKEDSDSPPNSAENVRLHNDQGSLASTLISALVFRETLALKFKVRLWHRTPVQRA